MSGHTGIIIQARTDSKRLPGKVIVPFINRRTILELIIERLDRDIKGVPVVVATTRKSTDDKIEEIVKRIPGADIYRGDEENVLRRFIDAAELFGFTAVIRICSDNLFIDTVLIRDLISASERGSYDYISHMLDGDIPVIKSHQGFYAEWVKTSALRKIESCTSDKVFQEHVTNFIYSNRNMFNIKWINAPDEAFKLNNLRLTIDTETDFMNCLDVFTRLTEAGKEINIGNIIDTVIRDKHLLMSMGEQIKINAK